MCAVALNIDSRIPIKSVKFSISTFTLKFPFRRDTCLYERMEESCAVQHPSLASRSIQSTSPYAAKSQVETLCHCLTFIDYYTKITEHEKQSPRRTLFVTECRRLAQFCNLQATDKQSDPNNFDEFAIIYDIFDGRAPIRKPGIARGVRNSNEDGDSNKLLFFSGYPSFQLLVQLGSHFDIDPEFFDLHLSFIKDSVTSCNMHPSYYTLPSTQCNIFQTSMTSIGATTVGDRRFRDLMEKRDTFKENMDFYLSNLKMGRGWKTYHSIVRQMEVHDNTRFSLEQNLTILVKRSGSDYKKWRGKPHGAVLSVHSKANLLIR